MRPKKPKTTEEGDLFRARLDQIINMKHELVQLAFKIDWDWIDGEIAPLYSDKGRPGIETRFVVGLLLLKHIYGLSDEAACDRWVHDPYYTGALRARDLKRSRWTPPCSPRPSPSQPMPSCCMQRSPGLTGWFANASCGCGSPICVSPNARP